MKKILTLAIAIAAINFSANAQTDRGDRPTKSKMEHKGQHDQFAQLNLTQDQQAKLKAQREAMKTQREAIKNSTASEEAKKQQMQALREKQKLQMQQILTADQQKKLKETMGNKSHAGKMNGKGGEGRMMKGKKGEGREMKNDLGLSNEQAVKMKAINQDFKTKAQAIKANTSLSEEAKKAQLQTLRKQTMVSRQGLLTPEQLKKSAEMRNVHADKKQNKK